MKLSTLGSLGSPLLIDRALKYLLSVFVKKKNEGMASNGEEKINDLIASAYRLEMAKHIQYHNIAL